MKAKTYGYAMLLVLSMFAMTESDNLLAKKLIDEQVIIAQRGCCSHHGGVCGCSSGRAKCCDGSLSPSCGC